MPRPLCRNGWKTARRRTFTSFVLPLALWLGTAPIVRAAVFSVITYREDEVTVLDPAATETLDGGRRRAWSVTVRKALDVGATPQPGYIRTLNEYDCGLRQMRWVSFSAYSRFGRQLVKEDNADPVWKPATEAGPDLPVVCSHVDAGGGIAAASLGQLVTSLVQAWDDATPLPPLQTPHVSGAPTPRAKRGHRAGRSASTP